MLKSYGRSMDQLHDANQLEEARETVVTTAIGVILGVFLGSFADPLIIKMVELPDLQFIRTFHPAAWIAAVILEILFAVIINSLGFRKVKNLNLRDVA